MLLMTYFTYNKILCALNIEVYFLREVYNYALTIDTSKKQDYTNHSFYLRIMQNDFFVNNHALKVAMLFYLTRIKEESVNSIKPTYVSFPILQHPSNERQCFFTIMN